jgi:chromosome segregation ATPase
MSNSQTDAIEKLIDEAEIYWPGRGKATQSARDQLAALKAELASLQAEIVKVNSYRETLRLRHHQVTDERDQLNAENEALRKDKNRLDWLEQSPHVRVEIRQLSQFDDYQTIRAAIDAAKGGQ